VSTFSPGGKGGAQLAPEQSPTLPQSVGFVPLSGSVIAGSSRSCDAPLPAAVSFVPGVLPRVPETSAWQSQVLLE